MEVKMAFLAQNTAILCQKVIIILVFKKNYAGLTFCPIEFCPDDPTQKLFYKIDSLTAGMEVFLGNNSQIPECKGPML
jgi:hypothetical protein